MPTGGSQVARRPSRDPATRPIDLADGDARKGNLILASPLTAAITFRGASRCSLGLAGWEDDIQQALTMTGTFDPQMRGLVMMYAYALGIANGALLFDAENLQETSEMLKVAERWGDDITLVGARFVRGIALVYQQGEGHGEGFKLLAQAHETILREQINMPLLAVIEFEYAKEMIRTGDLVGAIELSWPRAARRPRRPHLA